MLLISDRIKTFGDSMRPLLLNEDVVFFKKISYPKIKVDDIVVVKKNRRLFTHRVIYRSEKYLVTKGDSNNSSDGKIYSKDILGIVYKIKRDRQILGIDDLYLFQSTVYFQEIVKVTKAFEKAKIDLVFLKGLILHLYFENIHPRRLYRDCDILVAKSQFEKSKQVLQKIGYREHVEDFLPGLKKLKNREPEVNFIKMVGGIKVVFDLHQEIVFMAQMTGLNSLYSQKLTDKFSKELLSERKRVMVLGEEFPVLSTNNLLIYTALHLYHHNFVGTFRYELMKIFFEKEKMDYDEIINKIKRFQVKNFIYPSFVFLEKYYEVKIPDILMNQIRPQKSKADYIEKIIKDENIFDEGERVPAGVKRFEHLFFLSPNPLYKKSLIFFNPQVFYAVFMIINRRVGSFFNLLLPRN